MALNKVVLMLTLCETKAPECRAVLNLIDDATPEQALKIAKDFSKTEPNTPFSAEYWDENGRVGHFECMNGTNLQDALAEKHAADAGFKVPSIESCREKLKSAGLKSEDLYAMKVSEICKVIDLNIPQSVLDPELTYGELVGKIA